MTIERFVTVVDTSVLVEYLGVPGMCSDRDAWMDEIRVRIKRRDVLVLPLVVLVETGNHIGQNGRAEERRQIGEQFATLVRDALDAKGPFVVPDVDRAKVRAWIEAFPAYVARDDKKGKGSGLGDLAILDEVARQAAMHRDRKVEVLTKDEALARRAQETPAAGRR